MPAASPRWPGLPKEVRKTDRRARRGRQHHQGGHQGLRHRLGRPRRAGAVRRLLLRPRPTSPRTATIFPYFKGIGDDLFDLSNPYVVAGLLFGGLIPYLFGGIAMTAVGRAAGSIVEEVRRQFREKPGIMQGTEQARLWPRGRPAHQGRDPRDDRAVAAAGAGADRRLFRRSADLRLKASAFAALGALLLGVIVNGLFVAISMTSGGGAWDNAKKSFEDGFIDKDGVKHIKGSEAHKAVGDRRHRRRPLQGHRRPGREPDDQDHQHRGAAAARGPRALTAKPR